MTGIRRSGFVKRTVTVQSCESCNALQAIIHMYQAKIGVDKESNRVFNLQNILCPYICISHWQVRIAQVCYILLYA